MAVSQNKIRRGRTALTQALLSCYRFMAGKPCQQAREEEKQLCLFLGAHLTPGGPSLCEHSSLGTRGKHCFIFPPIISKHSTVQQILLPWRHVSDLETSMLIIPTIPTIINLRKSWLPSHDITHACSIIFWRRWISKWQFDTAVHFFYRYRF